jgi:DNA-binding CsgD family transcriptional regulator
VLLEGEAGIGKSRLIREFLAAAARGRQAGQENKTLVAWCPPFRQPLTLGPVVDALRRAAADVRGLRLTALTGVLRPLFPEWAAWLPPLPEPLEDAAAARHRLFRALAELLDRLGVVTLVVEDVHWADEATLEFLLSLAVSEPPALNLVLTCRPEDVPAGSLLPRLSRQAAGSWGLRLTLDPLTVADTARLVSSMLTGGHVSDEFVAFLHERTEGLPLAMEESVRLLGDRFDLAAHDGVWLRRRLDAIKVAPTLRDAVLERAERLSADAGAVLRAAAILAHPATEAVLAEVSGLPAGRGREGLCEALASGLLAEDKPDGRGLTGFRHVLAAQAVHETIPGPERRMLHQRAGHALEDIAPLPLARLARHFREAGDADRWCRYGEQAADMAMAAGDAATSAEILHEILVSACAELPVSVVVRLCSKFPLEGLGGSALAELARSLRSALDTSTLSPADRAQAGLQLGRILLMAREYEAGATELEAAISLLADRPREAIWAMLSLANPAHLPWHRDVHRQWLDRVTAEVAKLSLPDRDRLQFGRYRAIILLKLGEEAGWAPASSIPVDAATAQEARLAAMNCVEIGDEAVRWGRYEPARQRLTAALELAGRYHYPRLRDGALVTLVHLDYLTGAWTGLADRAAALAGHDEPATRLEATLAGGLLDAACGAREAEGKLRFVLDEAWHAFLQLAPEAAAALARLRLADGQAGDALALTDEPMRFITSKEVWLWATDVAPVRVQALAAAGRCGEAAKVAEEFARALRGRDAPAPLAALALCRAVLAEGQGEQDRAATLFGQAAAAWAALPRPYDALLARERQACCLFAAGRDESGVAVLTEVLRGLSRLGARGDAGRVARILRGHGADTRHVWRGGRRGYGDRLSPRELEVVRLAVTGQTNREIGQVLSRSPRTVAMQLGSAMRKLEVSSRTALAAAFTDTARDHLQGEAGESMAAP